MKSVNTKLSDEVYEEIIKRGETPYKFLQKAAEEKLQKESKNKEFENLILDIVKGLNIRLESIDSELRTNNTIAKEKLGIIAEQLGEN